MDETEADIRREVRSFLLQGQHPHREYLSLYSDPRGERVQDVEPPALQPSFIKTTGQVAWEDATPIDEALFVRMRSAGWVLGRQYGVGSTAIPSDDDEIDAISAHEYSIGGYAFERERESGG